MKDEFYFPSKDGNTEIHTIEWKPEGSVKAVLQLSHGMVEYIGRYDEFAQDVYKRQYRRGVGRTGGTPQIYGAHHRRSEQNLRQRANP